MAIYHLSAKAIGRAQGRSATGAAAYRAAVAITDARTGTVHDYTRKGGVVCAELILPGGGSADRAEFWNRIEAHHKRGDAILAREIEVALPFELSAAQRQQLVTSYASELTDRYQVAVDLAIHEPSRYGDQRNHHAHLLISACHVLSDGSLGKKAVELDPVHCQKNKIENMVERERKRWQELANEALQRAGVEERIDRRTLDAQGIKRLPTRHRGPHATAVERRRKMSSRRRADDEREQKRHDAQRRDFVRLDGEIFMLERELESLRRPLARPTQMQEERMEQHALTTGRPAVENDRMQAYERTLQRADRAALERERARLEDDIRQAEVRIHKRAEWAAEWEEKRTAMQRRIAELHRLHDGPGFEASPRAHDLKKKGEEARRIKREWEQQRGLKKAAPAFLRRLAVRRIETDLRELRQQFDDQLRQDRQRWQSDLQKKMNAESQLLDKHERSIADQRRVVDQLTAEVEHKQARLDLVNAELATRPAKRTVHDHQLDDEDQERQKFDNRRMKM